MQYEEKIVPMAYPDYPKLENFSLTKDLLGSMKKPLFMKDFDYERNERAPKYIGYVCLIVTLFFWFFIRPIFDFGLDGIILGIIASVMVAATMGEVFLERAYKFFERRFEDKYKNSVHLERYLNFKAYQKEKDVFFSRLKQYGPFKRKLGLPHGMNVISYDPSTHTAVCEGYDHDLNLELFWDEKRIYKDYKLHSADQPAWIKKSRKDETPDHAILEVWYLDGKKNRIDKPAYIERDPETGVTILEQWCVNESLHRDQGPAQIERDPSSGNITAVGWYQNGLQHRTDGPAVIKYDPISSKTISEVWVFDGKEHRDGGASSLYYDVFTNVVTLETWSQHGLNHRDGGPACIERDPKTGSVIREMWYRYGVVHRNDGPAIIEYLSTRDFRHLSKDSEKEDLRFDKIEIWMENGEPVLSKNYS